MHVGVDFDNTIVSYDALFHAVCRERGLIPPEVPARKGAVRDYLRRVGREADWTEIQGYVYGARMAEAQAFAGVREFFRVARAGGATLTIISHKTRSPYLGQAYDLHRAAWDWLEEQGFFDPQRLGLPRERVHFELTKAAKLERIAQCGCTHFIDDLPEFLLEPGFPAGTQRLLFDPNNAQPDSPAYRRVSAWPAVWRLLTP